ncbi:MAG: hypothetical protein QXS27_03735 [Candidatus Jordarchaeaceae archaeon]
MSRKISFVLTPENYQRYLELKKKPEFRLASDAKLLNYLLEKAMQQEASQAR